MHCGATPKLDAVHDRRVENVGELRSALHPAVKSGIQRHKLLVSTKANVLASMDIRDGSICAPSPICILL